MEISLGKHRLSFETALIKEFENVVLDSFERCAQEYIKSQYHTSDIEEIFATRDENEIKSVIQAMAIMEIDVYSDFFT